MHVQARTYTYTYTLSRSLTHTTHTDILSLSLHPFVVTKRLVLISWLKTAWIGLCLKFLCIIVCMEWHFKIIKLQSRSQIGNMNVPFNHSHMHTDKSIASRWSQSSVCRCVICNSLTLTSVPRPCSLVAWCDAVQHGVTTLLFQMSWKVSVKRTRNCRRKWTSALENSIACRWLSPHSTAVVACASGGKSIRLVILCSRLCLG